MNGLNGIIKTTTRKMPLFPYPVILAREQRRHGCNEDCIAAFQRLQAKSFMRKLYMMRRGISFIFGVDVSNNVNAAKQIYEGNPHI